MHLQCTRDNLHNLFIKTVPEIHEYVTDQDMNVIGEYKAAMPPSRESEATYRCYQCNAPAEIIED